MAVFVSRNESSDRLLAHNVGNSTEAAYMRSDLFDQRRTLMDAWAEFVAGGVEAEETDG